MIIDGINIKQKKLDISFMRNKYFNKQKKLEHLVQSSIDDS